MILILSINIASFFFFFPWLQLFSFFCYNYFSLFTGLNSRLVTNISQAHMVM